MRRSCFAVFLLVPQSAWRGSVVCHWRRAARACRRSPRRRISNKLRGPVGDYSRDVEPYLSDGCATLPLRLLARTTLIRLCRRGPGPLATYYDLQGRGPKDQGAAHCAAPRKIMRLFEINCWNLITKAYDRILCLRKLTQGAE